MFTRTTHSATRPRHHGAYSGGGHAGLHGLSVYRHRGASPGSFLHLVTVEPRDAPAISLFPFLTAQPPNPQTYGRVYDCTRRSDDMKCVLKQVPLGGLSDHDRRETLKEASILRSAQSKHVVAYVDSWEDRASDCLYIVMEHAGEDLSRVMKANGGALPEEDVWRYILPVARGLKHLHSLRILHRDLKPANIFRRADGDEAERVVIGDLGLGRVLGAHSDFAKTGVGTPLYFSPELAQEKPYNDKSDVWAFGCLAHELLVGKPPFEAKNQLALASKIVHAPAPSLPDSVSPDLAFVIHKALTKDPDRRPSMTDLLGLSCVRERVRAAKARAEARATRDAETRRERLERRLREDRAVLDSERAAFEREKAEMESKAAALSLAVSLEDVEGMAERIRQLESANAALAARLEDTETRLADAERARVALAGKLETAVSAAASAAATPYKPAASPATGQHVRETSDSFGRSPGASGGSDGARKSQPASATKALVSAFVSPPRDAPSRPPAVADDVDAMDDQSDSVVPAVEGEPDPSKVNDRYGAAGAEEDDASVPPSPIAPASAAESRDDDFYAEKARGPAPSRFSSPGPRHTPVARSLLYDEDASFESLASFGRSRADDAADASVDSAAFGGAAPDAAAASLEPSACAIRSASVARAPRTGATRESRACASSAPAATDAPTPPLLLELGYTHSVFRPIAPAPEPRRAGPEASADPKENRPAMDRNERKRSAARAASKPAFGKRETAPTRPVARLPRGAGCAPVTLATLGVGPLSPHAPATSARRGEEEQKDAEAPFAAALAWRRARVGEDTDTAPAMPPPVGSTSRVWNNRAILSLAPSAASAFLVLYRCVEANGGRASPLRRAKLRGQRARSDDFASCALVPPRARELKRVDGVAPWRCAEIVPPAGALASLGGAWVELVLEFAAPAAVDEVVVLEPDARLRARFGWEAGKTSDVGSSGEKRSARRKKPSPVPNEPEPEPDTETPPKPDPVAVTAAPELRRWPGLAGGPVRVAPGAPAAASPAREASAPAAGARSAKREAKTPAGESPRGVFAEGRSPDGPLASVSFTPPGRGEARERDADASGSSTPPSGASGARAAEPAWPLKADQVAALLRRAERNRGDAARAAPEMPSPERRVRPPTEPEDRALVTDLLYQARLLQDAVNAAAERIRLDPGDANAPSRFAPPGSRGFDDETSDAPTRSFGSARPNSFRFLRRSRAPDPLRSIGHMANPRDSPPFDGLACESPALDATRSRRRPLADSRSARGSEISRRGGESAASASSAVAEGLGIVPRARAARFDEDSPLSSARGSSPAFDESASMRRRRLEGLLEPRQLF